MKCRSGRNPSVFTIFISLITLASGCAAGPKSAPAPAPAATPPRSVHLSRAIPLQKLRTDDTDFDLRNRMSINDQELYFGQLETTDLHDNVTATAPVVVAKIQGEWRALSLADERLPDAEFLFVASGPAKNEIWAILDNQIADPADSLLLAHSTDAAQTWTLTTLHKPQGFGAYDSFAMDKTGHGRLTVYLTHRESKGRSGFYHFRTSDDGNTWSAPDYEPDSLDPAADIPDDADPEPLQDLPPARTTLAPQSKIQNPKSAIN